MNSLKCTGCMALDPPMDFYVKETRWRCINCGATREAHCLNVADQQTSTKGGAARTALDKQRPGHPQVQIMIALWERHTWVNRFVVSAYPSMDDIDMERAMRASDGKESNRKQAPYRYQTFHRIEHSRHARQQSIVPWYAGGSLDYPVFSPPLPRASALSSHSEFEGSERGGPHDHALGQWLYHRV